MVFFFFLCFREQFGGQTVRTMGARCMDGEDGATWKSVDIALGQAQVLVADHQTDISNGSKC